jgi:hypothetical protein
VQHETTDQHQTSMLTQRLLWTRLKSFHRAISLSLPHGRLELGQGFCPFYFAKSNIYHAFYLFA